MKTLQRLCAALALTMVLSVSAFAGEMTTMVTAPPPPPDQAITQGEMTTMATGEMQTTANDSVTQSALDLLQRVLSIF
jgi:hypothetical protein